jgi:hypothetical protein
VTLPFSQEHWVNVVDALADFLMRYAAAARALKAI